jgi:serine/threonine-protein kinase
MDAESETQVLPRGPTPAPAREAGPLKKTDRLVGRYELLHRLGHGGMATVYLGRARGKAGFEKRVAVKVIHPHLANEPELVGMFLDEARIAAEIHHPHVVETLDLGEDDGVYFMVMEFIEGETLSALMRAVSADGVCLALPASLQIVADACEGLGAAHELRDSSGRNRHLVHRDVSPQNLMIGMKGWVKVADFGIMKAVGKTSHTRPGELRGKLAYMSPEQARGDDVDHRTDLFALGVIAWELCTGERLFAGDTDAATLEKVMRCHVPEFDPAQVPALDAGSSELTEALRQFFERALAAAPAQRFQSSSEMLSAVRGLQRLVSSNEDPRRQIAQHMEDKFGKRAEYLRASMRDGSPLRSKTRKRSSMVEVAAAARAVTASVLDAAPADEPSGAGEVAPVTSTSTLTASGRTWGLWLLLPMVGAGVAVAVMSMGRPEPAPVRAAEPATVSQPAPSPATVKWHFDTTPPGATIIIAGEVQPSTTPTYVELARGEQPVKVVLEKEGYEPTVQLLAPMSDQNFPYMLLPLRADAEKGGSAQAADSTSDKKKPKKRPASPANADGPTPTHTASGTDDDGKPKFKPSPFSDKSSNPR